jgi:hypothetical protein
MTYAIFGYKGDNDHLGDFLAEVKNKTEQEQVEQKAKQNGYTKFSYSYPDGSKPNFIGAISL